MTAAELGARSTAARSVENRISCRWPPGRQVGERPLDPLGIEVGERVVEQDRRRGAFGAQEPDELEPLHEIDLPLRAVRQGGRGRRPRRARASRGGRRDRPPRTRSRTGRRSAGRSARRAPLPGAARRRDTSRRRRPCQLGLGEPQHGVDVLEVGDALGRLLELLAELRNPGGGLLPLGEPGLERGGAERRHGRARPRRRPARPRPPARSRPSASAAWPFRVGLDLAAAGAAPRRVTPRRGAARARPSSGAGLRRRRPAGRGQRPPCRSGWRPSSRSRSSNPARSNSDRTRSETCARSCSIWSSAARSARRPA